MRYIIKHQDITNNNTINQKNYDKRSTNQKQMINIASSNKTQFLCISGG